ncbi:SPOR domain-containing protein [Chromobacterium alticapitis]|uniref:SPOR domain-containing protein n=1 Tax=Chromobacterium alticapitis TaxID=2073169 RepID=A0A2S5DI99_9NEIS|nr:SPOR domain-containing protein [Chromobacterium alticapitis]POZ62741.1 SPOR domain-containing protein [Chromobacterium alticapitis]
MREQNQQPAPHDGQDESELSGKLKKRLWIAGGLVAVAVAAIPLMDALTKPKVEMSSEAPTPSSGKIVKAASSPASGAITLPKAASAPAMQSSEPIAQTGAPAAPAENRPQSPDLSKTPAVANQQPSHSGAPHRATPADAHSAGKTAAAEQAPAKAAPSRPENAPARSAPPAAQAAPPSMDQAPSAKVAPAPAPMTMPAAKAEPPGSSVGYQVQLGLFASMGNAQKLVRDLQKHGIAAHTITRVQIGPFKNRAEAEDTMKKLRELGYAPLLSANGQ